MFFKKKRKIRKVEDQRLVEHIEVQKEKLMNLTRLVKNSVEPSEEVIFNLNMTEAKFHFLLKEARMRNENIGKSLF